MGERSKQKKKKKEQVKKKAQRKNWGNGNKIKAHIHTYIVHTYIHTQHTGPYTVKE